MILTIIRGLTRGCVMWDLSYFKLTEISGSREAILTSLNTMTRPEVGPGFLHRPGEASVILFTPGSYPGGVIGKVRYAWAPPGQDVLWIWCHPGHYQLFLETLTSLLSLETVTEDVIMETGEPPESAASSDILGLVKLEPKLVPPTVMRGAAGISVTLIENRINRFRLRGPLSLAALRKCLPPIHIYDEKTSLSKHNNTVYSEKSKAEAGTIIGIMARDPRLTLPTQRGMVTEADIKTSEADDGDRVAPDWSLQQSGLWSAKARTGLKRASDHEVNTARRESRVAEMEGSAVMVIIIATEDGWDLVLPPGWAVNTWIGLVYTGVKVCCYIYCHTM